MESGFVEHVLPNGLRIVCEVMPRVRSAAVGFLARTGSRHEARHEHGVSHFLEHMCFKGTPTRDWRAINVGFDELGSIYNAFTSKEHTVYYGWVPAERLSPQVELLADMMRPALPKDDFETDRNVILEEIPMAADSFDHHVWNALHEILFANHSLAHEVLGEHETNYHARRYSAGNVMLLAAGNLDPQALFVDAGRCCGDWKKTPANGAAGHRASSPKPPGRGASCKQLNQFKQQTILEIFSSVPQSSPWAETIEVFTALFGGLNSRCYWNVVQKGVCTQAGAAWLAYEDFGAIALFANGEPDKAEEMLAAVRQQAREVVESGFRPDEVQRVKNRRRTQLALEAESPRTRLMQLIDDIETQGRPRTSDAHLAAVEAVTPQRIAEYLKAYPITGEGLLLSCGPRAWP
ncbi:MAG: insulinase family protein [Planctomycetes bacterium]|nr:insulinase family protein [Planctomycetota bacterium]